MKERNETENLKTNSGRTFLKGTVLFGILLLVSGIASIYAWNYYTLQSPLNEVTEKENNRGIEVSVYYKNYIEPSTIVYDLQDVSADKSMVDVFRVFLQYAEKSTNNKFDLVLLAFRGQVKFQIKGSYFRQLGEEYSYQNPVYTARTFPENLYLPDGTKAFSKWEGGAIGVTKEQMEDFNEFHEEWYINELINE